MYFGSLYCQQYGPRSDCSFHTVWFDDEIILEGILIYAADIKADNIFWTKIFAGQGIPCPFTLL